MENRYCSIFVADSLQLETFRDDIFNHFGLKKATSSCFETEWYEINVINNSDYNNSLQCQYPDGFLYFKFKLEIDFKEAAPKDYHVRLISEILEWLWNKMVPAVAACDYESRLSMSGGYNNSSIPWPK